MEFVHGDISFEQILAKHKILSAPMIMSPGGFDSVATWNQSFMQDLLGCLPSSGVLAERAPHICLHTFQRPTLKATIDHHACMCFRAGGPGGGGGR